MFRCDSSFIGDHHPVTFIVAIASLVADVFLFKRQLRLQSCGANFRMAIATIIVFSTPRQILARLNFFNEIWRYPDKYAALMIVLLLSFIPLLAYFVFKPSKDR